MDKNIKPDELMELYQTARQIIWRYNLDKMETAALKTAMKSIEKAAYDILSNPSKQMSRWEQLRRQDLIKELESLTAGIREQVTSEISSLASQAGAESANYHSHTMSVGGKLPGVNNVALSPEQFKSFFETTPMGGYVLSDWVNRSFDATVQQGLLEDLGAGMLQGKGYPGLVDSIMGHMKDFTRKEAVTLARTFVQTANVSAMSAVMDANSDIVNKWKWSSVLENSNMRTGTGTCIRCACNDGNQYKLGEGPPIPLHPNCRCVKIPVTVTFRELGIDIDEFEEVARPWTTRPDIPIGEGGRNILTWGSHKGEYASWFESRGEQFQKTVVGPKRLALIQSGKVSFKDLVDQNTGRLYRLDELVGGGAKGGVSHVLIKSIPEAELKMRQMGVKSVLFGDSNIAFVNETVGALSDLKIKYPVAWGNLVEIDASKSISGAIAEVSDWGNGATLKINKFYSSKTPTDFLKGANPRFFSDPSVRGTVTHEFGHVVDNHIRNTAKGIGEEALDFRFDTLKNIQKTAKSFPSDYAKQGHIGELFAESFVEISLKSSGKWSDATRSVYELIKDMDKKYGVKI